MTTDPLDRLERLFRAARMHPPDERAAFLDAACADDPALRAEVEALLAADADAEADGFLARPATGLLGDAARAAGDGGPGEAPDPLLDRLVGPYRVLRPLGEGGMGAVYLAVREEPFLRYVALKVVRAGLHAPEVVRRFEQERQILASLNHPNIARLLDGGVTDDGLPYFAMEYVEGRPITTYCDEHRLSIEERLRLFRAVCEAVHYAHQNLVLHRDLKPSNILVATDGADGKPTVKLLDFGIAKVLNPHLSPSAMPVTRTALRVMTPEYASPEQVRGEPLSTASDVYSLGVVLYELLTGHRPYRITTGSTEEIVRVVCEQEPERPSTKVVRDETIARGNGEETITAKAVGAARGAHPERLRRRLRGDLDTVVLMALRKEPQRRYASAEQLGRDLDRYRQGLPVLAHRDSRAYRLGKLVRRHKTATALVLVVLASVIGFALFSSWQARRVAEERDRAQTAQAKAEQVAAFLVSLFGQADPTETLGDTLTVREVLDAGARRVEAELAGQPEVQAAVLSVIAQAYRSLGRPADAVPLLERALALRRAALGDEHPDTAESLFTLANLYELLHEVGRAEALYREHLALAERLHGTESTAVVVTLYHLGTVLHVQGRTDEAFRFYDRWQALLARMPDRDDPVLAGSLGDLGDLLFTQRRYDEGEPFARRALAMHRRLFGDRSPQVGIDLNRLCWILNATERYDEAEAVAREALALHRQLYPDGHYELGASLANLGEALQGQGRYDEAEALFQEDLALRRRLYPDGHHTEARSLALLARLEHDRGRLDDAERYYREAIAVFTRLFGPDYLPTIQHRLELTDVLRDRGDYAQAERLLLADYATLETERGRDDRTTQLALARLARLYDAWGRPEDAARYRALLLPETTDA
ncbi:MAG TPA: serine/threonine-protein kinase [Rubricoccaceae bacterium]|nr:serine/threonine-protein kinase [Rubricoccaceae bacterium]